MTAFLHRLRSWYHFVFAFLSALGYGFPSRALTVIGVTGTDGKTTVVHLLHEMLAAGGHRVGSVSSLRFNVADREEPNLLKMTMPGRGRLQRFLAECRRAGCRFAIIEVTSQGIAQSRHRFIRFQGAVLTNISPEHIESHGGFERYREAKMELFRRLPSSGFAVLNREDPSAELFAAATAAGRVWYSREMIDLQRVGRPVRVLGASPERLRLEIDGVYIEPGFGGAFNISNILASAAGAMAHGVSLAAIASALAAFRGVPGRFEFVQRAPFAVVVDYAVTPQALRSVYLALAAGGERSEAGSGELICVLGSAGGGRDRWKRPELGRIAGRYCQRVILTSDDPDDEDPAGIAAEILSGMTNDEIRITKIVVDRRAAIQAAIISARPGDTVIITGMGAQPWLVIDGKKIPWDDREVVRDELATLPER